MAHLPHILCFVLFFQDELNIEERLAQATVNFKNAGDSSVPVILNIFGTLKKIMGKNPNVKTLQNLLLNVVVQV